MMAFRSIMRSKIPMVIILGATGTGKTKLGVELAQKFLTEIISADSMQIYKGLDVVTAKASRQERELVRHHLLDILEPHQMFTVVDFRSRALKIMDELIESGKMPIIVGGTNYYMESIIYNILVEDMNDTEALLWDKSRRKRDLDDSGTSHGEPASKKSNLPETFNDECKKFERGCTNSEPNAEIDKDALQKDVDNEKSLSNEDIHSRLKTIDPVMAGRLHPNNRRKMLRSIEVWLKTSRQHSEILDQQKLTEGQLRRPGATIVLWLTCEQNVHDERLNARVDSMLEDGLIQELLDFHDRHNKQRIKDGTPPDYTKGVFQTLGFKEFHDYLMMTAEQRESEEGKKLLQLSIDNMKMATRRYARRQNKMVRGRFLEHPNREVPPIYMLDTTDISKWDIEVKNNALHIIESHLNESPCRYEPLKPITREENKNIDVSSNNFCEVCKRIIIGDKEFAIHLNSNRHKKVLKKNQLEEKKNQDTAHELDQ